ncbi:MAG: hypothetical protein F6K28_57555 [Microcoleus sp. SIO2G3]|nr:hypothetical protein [Microcoleus sp. SIO2G3]
MAIVKRQAVELSGWVGSERASERSSVEQSFLSFITSFAVCGRSSFG